MTTAAITPAILSLDDCAKYTSLGKSTIQQLVRDGNLPKPRLLCGRRVGWLRVEIDQWAQALPVADLLMPANTGAGRLS